MCCLLFQERLLNVNFSGLDDDTKMEVTLFLTAIEKNPPTMNLNGFADVNRRLITSVSFTNTFFTVKNNYGPGRGQVTAKYDL